MTPNDRKYAKTHEWVKIENGLATVGITDHAQKSLGDITFVELPKTGKTFAQNAACAVVESVKAASDIFAPVAGEVAEINAALDAEPQIVNQDPYGAGWIFKLKNPDMRQLGALMDAAAYDASVRESGAG